MFTRAWAQVEALRAEKEQQVSREVRRRSELKAIAAMSAANADEVAIMAAIMRYKAVFSDFGDVRKAAVTRHLQGLRRLLLPTQVRRPPPPVMRPSPPWRPRQCAFAPRVLRFA